MSGPLPHWAQRLLGLRPGEGESARWTLDGAWPWAPWLTLLAVAAAVLWVLWIYGRENPRVRRRWRLLLAATRLALLAVVCGMLAQATLRVERTGLPCLVILLDDSRSMTAVDPYERSQRAALEQQVRRAGLEGLSRWDLARAVLCQRDAAALGRLAERYKLRLYLLSGLRGQQTADLRAAAEELRAARPLGESSPLGAAVRDLLDHFRGTPPAAIVLLSDGINTEGPSLAAAADDSRDRGVPLYAVAFGEARPRRDLKLAHLAVSDTVFVDSVVAFEAQLSAAGLAGKPAQLRLREAGKPEILAAKAVTLPADGRTEAVALPYRPPREGQFRYVLEVQPLDDEADTRNNRQEAAVRVVRSKIKVLLVEAEPTYEYRFLRNALLGDPSIELKTFLQSADPQRGQWDATALETFPLRREDLFAYDVIILGDVNPATLSAATLKNLADFVDDPAKGGTLVCLAGPAFMPRAYRDTPLDHVLPVDPALVRAVEPTRPAVDGFQAEPTEVGQRLPPLQIGDGPDDTAAAWQSLAPLYWMLEAPEVRPGAMTLLQGRGGAGGAAAPLVVLRYAAAGKVLLHATDETWRWRGRAGSVYFTRYWVQMLRFLAHAKLADPRRAVTLDAWGAPPRLRARFADEKLAPLGDDGVTVVVERPGQKTRRVTLRRAGAARGVFEAVLADLPPGKYHAWMATPRLPAAEAEKSPNGPPRDGPPPAAPAAPAVDFEVPPPRGEMDQLQVDHAELRQVAEQTKGRLHPVAEADELFDDLPEGRQVPMEVLPPWPLWKSWPVLLLFVLLLAAEWCGRKWGEMA